VVTHQESTFVKRIPTSMRDLTLTVACVQHSDLDTEHRHFLLSLAPFASYQTGRNVYPGFEFLCAATQKSGESVRRYARHCERLGLLELIKKPNGKKGVSTEWRICLEHPAFLDDYPGRKEVLGPQEGVDQWSASGPQKPGKAVHRKQAMRSTEAGQSGPQVGVDPSTPTSTPPSTPTSQVTRMADITFSMGEKEARARLKETRQWMQRRYVEKTNEGLRATKDQWKETEELIVEFGHAAVRAVWDAFLVADDLPNGWKFPLTKFNAEFISYLVRAEGDSQQFATHRNRLWNVRKVVCFGSSLGGASAFDEFKETMTGEEAAVLKAHTQYLQSTREDASSQLERLDLSKAGALLRLYARAKIWMDVNKDLVAKRYAEMDAEQEAEAITADTGVSEEQQ
jgi:hypothetical protein